ncbi:MAG: SDR family oxidoreductase [Lachnospiraceae bacterium]|jgi:sorbitol-6-phosphate 2-dehydrogenase
MKQGEFINKTAIVTGAGRGIGEALAKALIAEGMNVVVSDINKEALDCLFSGSKNVRTASCDVTDLSQCEELIRLCTDTFGDPDFIISNAGILISGALDEIDPDDWKKVIEVNLYGTFHMLRVSAPIFKRNRRGCFVSINSKSGKKGSYKSSAYASSKFGGLGLIQSAALELAEYGVRVNAICPGNLMDSPLWTQGENALGIQYAKNRGISTEECRKMYDRQVPMGRTCRYEDIINMMLFLMSDDSGYITGQAMNVTGGFEMR